MGVHESAVKHMEHEVAVGERMATYDQFAAAQDIARKALPLDLYILAVLKALPKVREALGGKLPPDTPPSVRARIDAALALLPTESEASDER